MKKRKEKPKKKGKITQSRKKLSIADKSKNKKVESK